MEQVFEAYAQFYDDFYREKDYAKEVDFVLALVKKAGRQTPVSVLDIGCGTAKHLIPFVKKGIQATGFDLSPMMVAGAKKNFERENLSVAVQVGDARSYRDGKTYDLVVSMFAVLGYLNTNDDFMKGLATARAHMGPHSSFVFDLWFGPAVLHQKPETRVQEFMSGGHKTIRIVRPHINIEEQNVSIDYDIMKLDDKRILEEAHERHTMRYFFLQELRLFLKNAGLELVEAHPFMDLEKKLTGNDWNISLIAKPI